VKNMCFARSVVLALGLAILSSIAFTAFELSFHSQLFLLAPSLCLIYLLSIGRYRCRKTGWASGLVLWCAFALLLWLLAPSMTDYALVHVAALSAMRALFFHKNLPSVMLDFALSALAAAAAFWAAAHTGSIFLTAWCFFLVQAAFVMIPGNSTTKSTATDIDLNAQQFDVALRKAEEALRKVAT